MYANSPPRNPDQLSRRNAKTGIGCPRSSVDHGKIQEILIGEGPQPLLPLRYAANSLADNPPQRIRTIGEYTIYTVANETPHFGLSVNNPHVKRNVFPLTSAYERGEGQVHILVEGIRPEPPAC